MAEAILLDPDAELWYNGGVTKSSSHHSTNLAVTGLLVCTFAVLAVIGSQPVTASL